MKQRTYQENINIEKAIKYLVKSIEKSRDHQKPEILHGIKVGMYLYFNDYAQDIVVSGILHDLLEETKIKINEIEKEFGKDVAQLINANSYDDSLSDKWEKYLQTFKRSSKVGKDALIIKAADILDNSFYYNLATDVSPQLLFKKMGHFIENSRQYIGKEIVWRDLKKQYEKLHS